VDPDTVWGAKWGRSRDGVLGGVCIPQVFCFIGLNGVFECIFMLHSCVKI